MNKYLANLVTLLFLMLSLSLILEDVNAQCIVCSDEPGFCSTQSSRSGSEWCGCFSGGCTCGSPCGGVITINPDTTLHIKDILNGTLSIKDDNFVAIDGLPNKNADSDFSFSISLLNIHLLRDFQLYHLHDNIFLHSKKGNEYILAYRKCLSDNASQIVNPSNKITEI